uniref:Pre-mRNA splicing factor n=1 Tax=Solanum tuberosum TaxID=4113 RepID=M1CN38_SOLTU
MGSPHLHQPPFPPFYEQQLSLHFGRADYDHSHKSFKGLSRPLPSDVEMELTNVLNSLNGTKESSKGAKNWFMQVSIYICFG